MHAHTRGDGCRPQSEDELTGVERAADALAHTAQESVRQAGRRALDEFGRRSGFGHDLRVAARVPELPLGHGGHHDALPPVAAVDPVARDGVLGEMHCALGEPVQVAQPIPLQQKTQQLRIGGDRVRDVPGVAGGGARAEGLRLEQHHVDAGLGEPECGRHTASTAADHHHVAVDVTGQWLFDGDRLFGPTGVVDQFHGDYPVSSAGMTAVPRARTATSGGSRTCARPVSSRAAADHA